MINVAIVEDNISAAKALEDCVKTYQASFGEQFNIIHFPDAISFLTNYRPIYDIVFMDIEMPNLDGLEASYKLRKFDNKAILIFVTNMAQFAVKGYEVDALDFIVKPVSYQNFYLKLKKAIDIIKSNQDVELVVNQQSGMIRLSSKEIYYVEVSGHKLIYHTAAETVSGYGALSELEVKLKKFCFMRCNSCYLVNPKYISSVQNYTVYMRNGDELQISHPKKKAFMTELADWLGQGNSI